MGSKLELLVGDRFNHKGRVWEITGVTETFLIVESGGETKRISSNNALLQTLQVIREDDALFATETPAPAKPKRTARAKASAQVVAPAPEPEELPNAELSPNLKPQSETITRDDTIEPQAESQDSISPVEKSQEKAPTLSEAKRRPISALRYLRIDWDADVVIDDPAAQICFLAPERVVRVREYKNLMALPFGEKEVEKFVASAILLTYAYGTDKLHTDPELLANVVRESEKKLIEPANDLYYRHPFFSFNEALKAEDNTEFLKPLFYSIDAYFKGRHNFTLKKVIAGLLLKNGLDKISFRGYKNVPPVELDYLVKLAHNHFTGKEG